MFPIVSTANLAAAWWFEAHLIPWSLDDMKKFSQQIYSVLFWCNLQPCPPVPVHIHSHEKRSSARQPDNMVMLTVMLIGPSGSHGIQKICNQIQNMTILFDWWQMFISQTLKCSAMYKEYCSYYMVKPICTKIPVNKSWESELWPLTYIFLMQTDKIKH